MSQPRPFKRYLFVYKDKEGNKREAEVFGKDSFQAKCNGIEQTRNDLGCVCAIKQIPEFDWDD
jgi:hypothetical protein